MSEAEKTPSRTSKASAGGGGKGKKTKAPVKQLFADVSGGGGASSSSTSPKWIRKHYDVGKEAWKAAYKKRTAGLRSGDDVHTAHKMDAHLLEKFQVDPASVAHNKNYRMVARTTNLSIHSTIMNRLEFQHDAKDRTPLAAYKTPAGKEVTTQMIADRVSIMIETAKIAGANGKRPIDNAGFREFLNVAADSADLDRRIFGKDVLQLMAADPA